MDVSMNMTKFLERKIDTQNRIRFQIYLICLVTFLILCIKSKYNIILQMNCFVKVIVDHENFCWYSSFVALSSIYGILSFSFVCLNYMYIDNESRSDCNLKLSMIRVL